MYVIVTLDRKGSIVQAPSGFEGYIGSKFSAGIPNYSMVLELPEGSYDLEDAEVIDTVGAPDKDVTIYTHGKQTGANIWLFGGIKYSPFKFVMLRDDVPYQVCGKEVTSYTDYKFMHMEIEYQGDAMVIPNTQIKLCIEDDEPEVGDVYCIDLPYAMVADSKAEGCYYPYGPDGRRYYTKKEKASFSLGDAVERGQVFGRIDTDVRALKDDSGRNEYVDLIQEILRGAPAYYKDNERPIYSALRYAVAQRKGTM